jgi:hypothetical protein
LIDVIAVAVVTPLLAILRVIVADVAVQPAPTAGANGTVALVAGR